MKRLRFFKEVVLCLFLSLLTITLNCDPVIPFPMQFSIPTEKIVRDIPLKDKDFAHVIPGDLRTYIFFDESEYYKDYQRSYFALTKKKGGWDCMRHYEILANGCIPYFIDLDSCPAQTMFFLPKELIKEAMHLEGVSYLKINHKKFNKKRYFEILERLLEHTRAYLTCQNMALYLLRTINYKGSGKILFLSGELHPHYMRCPTLIGLKQIFKDLVIDFPKVPHIYKSYAGDIKQLYGRGFTYTKIIDDLEIDRTNIEQRIINKEFDLIIYGQVHKGFLFYDLVLKNYPSQKIVYVCGEDFHFCEYAYQLNNFFLREF